MKTLADYPDLCVQLHPTKNGDFNPVNYTYGSGKKVWWKCPEGDDHEWVTRIDDRTRGRGCPFCSGRRVSVTNNLLVSDPKIAKEWHPTKNGDFYPTNFTSFSGKKMWWKCPHGDDHEWKTAINNRTVNKRKCPFCANQKISKTNNLLINHPEIAKDWHPTKNGDLRPEQFTAGSSKLFWWKCPKVNDHEWKASINDRRFTGCPKCADFRFDHNLPALLYYIAINLDDGKILYKIGITNHSVEQRFPVRDRAKIRIVKLWRFEKGTEAEKFESDILVEFNEFKYTGPKIFRKGNTEIFTKDVLALDDGREVDLTADLPIFSRRQESFDF